MGLPLHEHLIDHRGVFVVEAGALVTKPCPPWAGGASGSPANETDLTMNYSSTMMWIDKAASSINLACFWNFWHAIPDLIRLNYKSCYSIKHIPDPKVVAFMKANNCHTTEAPTFYFTKCQAASMKEINCELAGCRMCWPQRPTLQPGPIPIVRAGNRSFRWSGPWSCAMNFSIHPQDVITNNALTDTCTCPPCVALRDMTLTEQFPELAKKQPFCNWVLLEMSCAMHEDKQVYADLQAFADQPAEAKDRPKAFVTLLLEPRPSGFAM